MVSSVLSKLDSACAAFFGSAFRPRWLAALAGPQMPRSACSPFQPKSQIDLRMSSRRKNHSRKEVIQPQVLLQLPCYDFTPITDHTLGASLPCGLVWRLLVQPAFVM